MNTPTKLLFSGQWKGDKVTSNAQDLFGEVLEQGSSLVKQTVKQVAKTPSDLAKAGAKQVNPLRQDSAGQEGSDQKKAEEIAKTKDFVEDLYKPSEKAQSKNKPPVQETEDQKLAKLRQELHSSYYQRLITRPKKPEEAERPQERVERQEKEDRWKLEEKKKKEQPIAVSRAAQKAEKFPGASG